MNLFLSRLNKFSQYKHLKLKYKLTNELKLIKLSRMDLTVSLKKIHSTNSSKILELILLIELFSGSQKAHISYFKQKYNEAEFNITLNSRRSFLEYPLYNLMLLFFPVFLKRGVGVKKIYDKGGNFNLSLKESNSLLFLPDVYFKSNTKLPLKFFFSNTLNKKQSDLILSYYKFPIFL